MGARSVQTRFWWGDLERDPLKDIGVDGGRIKHWIKKWVGGMDQFDLAQDRDRYWTLVHGIMSLRAP
jgi:hypothetical protein